MAVEVSTSNGLLSLHWEEQHLNDLAVAENEFKYPTFTFNPSASHLRSHLRSVSITDQIKVLLLQVTCLPKV